MLPALREELSLYPGPPSGHGAPTWSLLDPVRNLFFRIDWLTFEILVRWNLNDPQKIVESINSETPIEAEKEDVDGVVRFLGEQELIVRDKPDASAWLVQQARKRQPSRGQWLLHNYLFFRVPLWRPDAWLGRNQGWVAPFYSRGFLWLTLLAMVTGLLAVSQQWQTFTATLLDTFSWQGLMGYFLTLIGVKFLHELGHAFTAKRHGCRVPTMGVAFLVLFPVAYTDVNETWMLREKRQRLAIGAAGILTELGVAAWATLAWALLPEGFIRSAAFLLATTTWISTVLINASPFLRFDGYFLLMDWLDMPNLHQRAFDLARWRLREWLFRLREEIPEHLPRLRRTGLMLFGYGTWVYRVLVFGGIALLVFHAVPKPLGPFLAGVEIVYFIAMPIWREMASWRVRLPMILRSGRSLITLLVLIAIVTAWVIPWDQRVRAQGLLRPAQQFPVVAPGPSEVTDLPVDNGALVDKGALLLTLDSPDLNFQRKAAAARAAGLDWQAGTVGVDDKLRQQKQVIGASRAKVGAEMAGLAEEQARYRITAPFFGRWYLVNPDLHTGVWVGKNDKLAVLTDISHWVIETYLSEAELERVKIGDSGKFYSETPGMVTLDLKVIHIDRDATHALTDGMLASTRGGQVLVREKGRQLVPEQALYRLTLEPSKPYQSEQPRILRGMVVIQGRPQAWSGEFLRTAGAFLMRESGF